jgi:MoaA/NifB/PqqE/SkfB family radical SAM enzyme
MMYLRLFFTILLNRLGIIQPPSFVTYFVTWRCNSRCLFCDIWKKQPEPEEELTLAEIAEVFGQIRKPFVVRLTGGEPFLRPDLGEIINTIDKTSNPYMIHITTNGLLTGQIEKVFSVIQSLRKVHIKVSIDDVSGEHDRIRGFSGAYEKAIQTVAFLSRLSKKHGFHVGVNQAIVDEDHIPSYFKLKEALLPYGVPIYVSIAIDPRTSLYSGAGIGEPALSAVPFGRFSKEGLDTFITAVLQDGKNGIEFTEALSNQYHIKGMYNRFVHHKNLPRPECVALNNHVRILPNGDVPVCLYNNSVVGNLKKQLLRQIWSSANARQYRKWVHSCPGCWHSCESLVNAIFTGDILKGFLYRKQ